MKIQENEFKIVHKNFLKIIITIRFLGKAIGHNDHYMIIWAVKGQRVVVTDHWLTLICSADAQFSYWKQTCKLFQLNEPYKELEKYKRIDKNWQMILEISITLNCLILLKPYFPLAMGTYLQKVDLYQQSCLRCSWRVIKREYHRGFKNS